MQKNTSLLDKKKVWFALSEGILAGNAYKKLYYFKILYGDNNLAIIFKIIHKKSNYFVKKMSFQKFINFFVTSEKLIFKILILIKINDLGESLDSQKRKSQKNFSIEHQKLNKFFLSKN